MTDTREQILIEAVMSWAADCEGMPRTPSGAELLKALWTFSGGQTKPCDECDGECGEPCAPCTVEEAQAAIDKAAMEMAERAVGVCECDQNFRIGHSPHCPLDTLNAVAAEFARLLRALTAISEMPRDASLIALGWDSLAQAMARTAKIALTPGVPK